MKFALLGDHPDGLAMARALAESGRHELVAYCGPAVGAEYLKLWSLAPTRIGDAEEILADPAIEGIIVAGGIADRPAQLRRAVQSERHVLCVHPADENANIAYEAAMIQAETRKIVMPLLVEALHPAVQRLAQLSTSPQLIDVVRSGPERVLLETETEGQAPAFPAWDLLRALGGEIIELIGFAPTEDVAPDSPVLITGRFQNGGLFRLTLLPHQNEQVWSVEVRATAGKGSLQFPEGWPGPAELRWTDDIGQSRSETWPAWNPWTASVDRFEEALRGTDKTHPTWNDEIRALELDLAARRSIERRRSSTLEFQEATEEASFKGTMTLVGCGLLWIALVLLIVSVWVPQLGWAILPVLSIFLILQLFRWIVPVPKQEKPAAGSGKS